MVSQSKVWGFCHESLRYLLLYHPQPKTRRNQGLSGPCFGMGLVFQVYDLGVFHGADTHVGLPLVSFVRLITWMINWLGKCS